MHLSKMPSTPSSKETDPAENGNTQLSTNHLPHSLDRMIKELICRVL